MSSKKNQPYLEVINLNDELMEYKRLCRCKSEVFKYYLDWKNYISKKLDNLDSDDKLENFKHYLLYKKRSAEHFNAFYIPLMIFYFTVYFSRFEFLDNKKHIYINLVCFLIVVLVTLSIMLIESGKYNQEYCFFRDLIEIIEEKQDEQKEG